MINIIGNIFDSSGFSSHTRNLGRALGKVTEARYTVMADEGWELKVDDKELDMINAKPKDDEINLIITNPMYWRLNTQAKRNWVYLIFEGDKIPEGYVTECLNDEIEYIFVASNHTKDAVVNTVSEMEGDFTEMLNKIKVIPHGVDLSLFYPKDKPEKTMFVANKGFRNIQDRGGSQYALRAYFEEFTDKDNVEFLFKVNPAYGTSGVKSLIDQIIPRKEGLPMLNINVEDIPFNKLVNLYNSGNVFVATARAEAYNLPVIEAMACGLPVITTNFGGQTDFANNDNGWIISGELEEVKHEIMYEGIKWLTPSIPEIRNAMRQAHENKEIVNAKANKALETARDNTWDKTAELICSLI